MVLLTRAAVCFFVGMLSGQAFGLTSVTWVIDETIQRGESSLFWTSPTAIDLGLAEYNYDYEITKVTASARFFTTTVEREVTDLIGEPFDLTGGEAGASLPIVLVADSINDPSTGTQADVRIEVDENGFGQASFLNVALGQVDTPLGRLDIESLRVQTTIDLEGVGMLDPADFDADGTVNRNDYFLWRDIYGATDGTADANSDGLADAIDYVIWRDRFDSPPAAAAVPEPTAAGMVLTLGGLLLARRR